MGISRTQVFAGAILASSLLVLLIFLLLPGPPGETITIASWNIQVFGDKKAGNDTLMRLYADKLAPYDAAFVQEIRDADASGFRQLCAMIGNRTCVLSSRAGRSNSKEQYGAILAPGVTLVDATDYNPAHSSAFERAPLRVRLSAKGYNFTVYVIHTKPEDATAEIASLEKLVAQESAEEERVIVLGDLNADCSYYDESRSPSFEEWTWAIGHDDDTTVAKSECAYDRILLDEEAQDAFVRAGIDREGITREASDHYLVWAALALPQR